jgi:hypothetical protein
MKLPGLSLRCLLVVTIICAAGVPPLRAQAPESEPFPGVKAALTPQQYSAAGLSKLSPEEQAQLDEALKAYFSGASQKVAEQAATRAVDRAVKEKRVEPATFIDSHIVGTFTGWGPRTVFVLENGQRWKPVDSNSKASFPPVQNPQVFILRDLFGYKMAILGGTTLRVTRRL